MSFYDDASWVLIPEGIKEDVVYAQKPTNGLGDLQFTRASDATRTNSAGEIERTPWNLFSNSEMFSAWIIQNSSIGVNVALSPTGTLTADKLTPDATTAQHRILQSINFTGAGVFSVYAKADGYNFLSFGVGGGAGGGSIFFNVSNGTISGSAAGYTPLIENVGNGWYRCSIQSATLGLGSAFSYLIIARQAATTADYAGDGTSGVLLWGAQMVEGTDAKPYFATTNRQDVPRLDYRNADGTVSTCPRLLLEPQRTNSVRNSTTVGAVAGSPGTLPTNWLESLGGLTRQVVGVGTENGIQYVDLRFSGTATDTLFRLFTEASNQIVASNGQTWTTSNYIKVVAAPSPPSSYLIEIFERTAAGVFVTSGGTAIVPTSNLERFTFTRTLVGGATVERTQPTIRAVLVIGATYDFTIRIAAPQMELGAYATTFIPTTTAAVTRLADIFTRTNVYTNNFITAAGGTWFLDLQDVQAIVRDTTGRNFGIGDSTTTINNGFVIRSNASFAERMEASKYIGGLRTGFFTLANGRNKIAIKWNGSTADVFLNGVKQVSATAFAITVMEFITAAGSDVPKYINQSSLFPVPLTDEKCIEITTL